MPTVLLQAKTPVDVSLVEYDLTRGEDIFLSHVWERGAGPPIQRSGEGAPYMELIGGAPRQSTTHPFGLRLGTWLVREELRAAEIAEAEAARDAAVRDRRPPEDIAILDRTVVELQDIPAHDAVFENRLPGRVLSGQASCGDLTMNHWNVACVQGPLAGRTDAGPVLVALRDEALEWRTYSCLVKWAWRGALTIEQVRFRPPGQTSDANEIAWVRYGERWVPRANSIEFALSNQQVIRDGEVVPVVTYCHQFGDLRHLIEMPNLNPNQVLFAGEPRPGGGSLPRDIFNKPQYDPVWFGESAFLRDSWRNLLRTALGGPVLLALPPGPGEKAMRGALAAARYRETLDPLAALEPGGWRFVPYAQSLTLVEIYLRRNTYGWTMIGLTRDRRKILCLATKGWPGRTGFRLEEAAEMLRDAGAWDALLIDEGADTFHSLRNPDGQWRDLVKRDRGRMRAVLLFTRGKNEEAQKENRQ